MPARQSPIERAFFREDADGAKVFFPWGLGRGGYVLRGEADRKSALRTTRLLLAGVILVANWMGHALLAVSPGFELPTPADALAALAAPATALVLVLAGYALWAARFVEPLEESTLRITREERLREAAQETGPWKLALAGLGLCAAGAAIAWIDRSVRWLGLLTLLLGTGALAWGLVLRRAAVEAHAERRPRDVS